MIKKIAYPQATLRWTGLKVRQFRIALLKRASWSLTYQRDRIRGDHADFSSPLKGELPNKVEDGVIYLCCMDAEMTPEELGDSPELFSRLVRKWIPVIEGERKKVASCFENERPQAILSIQGYEPSSWVARTEAIRLGIPIVSIEKTALSDRILWDSYTGIAVNRNLSANYYWRYNDRLSESEVESSVARMLKTAGQRKSSDHASPDNPAELPKGRPVILFLGQVYTDSSILFGLRGWRDPIKVMEAALEVANKHDALLVVKLHPKEASGKVPILDKPLSNLTYRKILESERLSSAIRERRHLIVDSENRLNTYDLIEKSDLTVTINSQSGLEAMIRKRPTIVCGQAFYGDLGFTMSAENKEQLDLAVGKALSGACFDEAFYQSRCFAHIFFEYYCLKKSEDELAKLMLRAAKQEFSGLY